MLCMLPWNGGVYLSLALARLLAGDQTITFHVQRISQQGSSLVPQSVRSLSYFHRSCLAIVAGVQLHRLWRGVSLSSQGFGRRGYVRLEGNISGSSIQTSE
jgi:hypothetical protein